MFHLNKLYFTDESDESAQDDNHERNTQNKDLGRCNLICFRKFGDIMGG